MRKSILFSVKLFLLSSIIFFKNVAAQDTLPSFSVRDIGKNRFVISWTNNYPYTAQITIQRSFDSLSGYKSILSVPDPSSKQNGYADNKAVNDHMFYRLYILLDNGRYIFTTAKKPIKDTVAIQSTPPVQQQPVMQVVQQPTPVKDAVNINATATAPKNKEPLIAINEENKSTLPVEKLNKETEPAKEAIALPPVKKAEPVVIRLENFRTGDSAKIPISVVPQSDPNAYAPSLFVYTHPDGNIRIQVPNRSRLQRYRIRFYEADKTFLFELKNLPSPAFQLDKTNFLHGGWFLFELLEDNRVIEKHKLYLEKE
jgi:hypothetical protein